MLVHIDSVSANKHQEPKQENTSIRIDKPLVASFSSLHSSCNSVSAPDHRNVLHGYRALPRMSLTILPHLWPIPMTKALKDQYLTQQGKGQFTGAT